PLKVWVDGVGRIKVKERLSDNSIRVADINMQSIYDAEFRTPQEYLSDLSVSAGQHNGSEHGEYNGVLLVKLSYFAEIEDDIRNRVRVSDYTNPTFIYTADGETETVEPVTYTPTWLPQPPPIDELKAKLMKSVCNTAQFLNEANVHERAHRKVKVSDLCLDIQNPDLIKDSAERAVVQGVIDEVDNAINHFRSWVGAAWKHIDDLDAAATDAIRLKAVEFAIILNEELGHVDHVGRFQDRHSTSAWKRLLATRQLYRTRAAMVSGKLEIKPGDAFGGIYTKADWERLLLHYYNEAREHCHDLPPEDPYA
ncbi:MAG: hypothetical protein OXE50_16560, partial [Chloroflexi bacterium]|nr:hypothetical protein [Chloroflexota bacterium]